MTASGTAPIRRRSLHPTRAPPQPRCLTAHQPPGKGHNHEQTPSGADRGRDRARADLRRARARPDAVPVHADRPRHIWRPVELAHRRAHHQQRHGARRGPTHPCWTKTGRTAAPALTASSSTHSPGTAASGPTWARCRATTPAASTGSTPTGWASAARKTGAPTPHVHGAASVAVLFKDGKGISLGTLPGGAESGATGITDNGQVAGNSTNGTRNPFPDPNVFFLPWGETRGFVWRNGVMRDLGTLGGADTLAYAQNNRGQITRASYANNTPNPATGY